MTPKADDVKSVESGNTDVGNPDTEAGGAQPEVGKTETPTFTQADFDKFAAETKRKTKENAARELEAEKARIEREAKEAKLLEDQEWEKLAEMNAEEAKEAAEEAARAMCERLLSNPVTEDFSITVGERL